MVKIVLTRQACKDLDGLDERMLMRMKTALRRLAADLSSGKRLVGTHDNEWSYEVSEYRIIYRLENDRMTVMMLERSI